MPQRRLTHYFLFIALFTALALLLVGPSAPVRAATFTVTKTADTADGTCDNDCSLREAIIAANVASGADTVSIPAGFYVLTLTGTVGQSHMKP